MDEKRAHVVRRVSYLTGRTYYFRPCCRPFLF